MILETKTASIDTFSVTIQALHVSGKQMTLAVFRQLPNKTLRGKENIWGHVLYQIKDEGYEWAVVERDGVLVRCLIPPLVFCDTTNDEKNVAVLMSHLLNKTRPISFLGIHNPGESEMSRQLVVLQEKISEKENFSSLRKSALASPQLFISV